MTSSGKPVQIVGTIRSYAGPAPNGRIMNTPMEQLEIRRLLSVTLSETEHNDTRPQANAIQYSLDDHVLLSGEVNAPGDRDWFKLQLNSGDVVGGALAGQGGLDTTLRLFNNAGKLIIGND